MVSAESRAWRPLCGVVGGGVDRAQVVEAKAVIIAMRCGCNGVCDDCVGVTGEGDCSKEGNGGDSGGGR